MNIEKYEQARQMTEGQMFTMKQALEQKEKWMFYWMLSRSDVPTEMFMAFADYWDGLPE